MRFLSRAALLLSPLLVGPPAQSAPVAWEGQATAVTDFVFVIDATGSMGNRIDAVADGLSQFVAGLQGNQVDARFAMVLFGGAPELVLDFTIDPMAVQQAFGQISVSGAVPGFQNDHNVNPEASLEAIRIVLGASSETLDTTHVGGTGVLTFRPEARKNIILVTDEDSDLPFYPSNQVDGQLDTSLGGIDPPFTCPGLDPAWQQEVDLTAQAAIAASAYVNMLVGAADMPTACQLGNPADDVSDPDLSNYDPQATLANLAATGFENCLQGQLIAAGLVGRSFEIASVNTPGFVDNFFAAKVDENNPFFFCPGIECPCGNEALSPVAGCANSTGDGAVLSASGSLSVANDDLVLTVSGLPAFQWGAVYFGLDSDLCAPWGDGLRGIASGPPAAFLTLGNHNSGAAGSLTAGPGIVGQIDAGFGTAILPGSTWYFQGYYRDTNGGSPCGQRFNLSNALGITFTD